MAIHYDARLGRFRDGSGRLVSKDKAMRSSIARREYEASITAKTAGPSDQVRKRAAVAVVKKPASKPEDVRQAKPKGLPGLPGKPAGGASKPKKPLAPKDKVPKNQTRVPTPKVAGRKTAVPSVVRKPKPLAPKRKTAPKKPAQLKKGFRAFEESELPPWMKEGVVREYPRSWEWFPSGELYDYDDFIEDWGDYENSDTGSGGEREDES